MTLPVLKLEGLEARILHFNRESEVGVRCWWVSPTEEKEVTIYSHLGQCGLSPMKSSQFEKKSIKVHFKLIKNFLKRTEKKGQAPPSCQFEGVWFFARRSKWGAKAGDTHSRWYQPGLLQ